MSKAFKREINRSDLDTYINGNFSNLDEVTKILCMVYNNDLEIVINEDTCFDCGEHITECRCRYCPDCGNEYDDCTCDEEEYED